MKQYKQEAQEAARHWWRTNASFNSISRGYAICDSCSGRIIEGEGYLCHPTIPGSPDLICEHCFDRSSRPPYRSSSEASDLSIPYISQYFGQFLN